MFDGFNKLGGILGVAENDGQEPEKKDYSNLPPALFGGEAVQPESQYQQTMSVWDQMKQDPSSALLMMGLNMMANDNGRRNLGQVLGLSGLNTVQAYGIRREMDKKAAEKAAEMERMQKRDALAEQQWNKDFGLREKSFASSEQAQKFQQDMALRNYGLSAANAARGTYDSKLHAYVLPNGQVVRAELPEGMELGDMPENFTDVNALGKRYMAESSDYMNMGGSLAKLLSSAQQNSAAGDLGMIFGFMKVLDPTSVVREGEQATAQNAAGVPDQIRNAYNRALTGERLSPAQRKDFLKTAKGMFDSVLPGQKTRNNYFKELAQGYGMSPENILYDPYAALGGQVDAYLETLENASNGTTGTTGEMDAMGRNNGNTGSGTPHLQMMPGKSRFTYIP